jgi:hypothetical protein
MVLKYIFFFLQNIFSSFFFLLKFLNDTSLKSITLQKNQSVPLNVPTQHQLGGRLSVITEQSFQRRQEFSVKVKVKFTYKYKNNFSFCFRLEILIKLLA